LFPFGFGLSYTTFAYKNLSISPAASNMQQPVTVGFEVTNTGSQAAADVVQLYVGDPHNTVPRPPKELKGFSKVYLKPGETKQVAIELDARALSYYDVKSHNWKADPGRFSIYVGRSETDIQLDGKLDYQPTPK
jgi:beta-glucosidase